jgi:hypothetical protein
MSLFASGNVKREKVSPLIVTEFFGTRGSLQPSLGGQANSIPLHFPSLSSPYQSLLVSLFI